jgi:hypothetical protein
MHILRRSTIVLTSSRVMSRLTTAPASFAIFCVTLNALYMVSRIEVSRNFAELKATKICHYQNPSRCHFVFSPNAPLLSWLHNDRHPQATRPR